MHANSSGASTFDASLLSSTESPQNGRAGIKHWRHDLLAGFVVSLVSLPLSSGIAIASGAPPIYGILSSIIAGLIFPLIGGSFVTISGPAAGLAPALMATMVALGGAGDADHVGAGYPLLLVVILLAGFGQIIMAKLNLARYAAIFPAAAVEGMLGAIGVLIIIKALPLFLGYTDGVHAHGFVEYLQSVPHWWSDRNNNTLFVGAGTLLILFGVKSSKWLQKLRVIGRLPPHLFAVAFAIPAAAILGLREIDPRFLITVPEHPLSGISLPDFSGLWQHSELWSAALTGVVTLMLIDGVESLATAQAIDRIDPYKRQSAPNRLLMAMGLSNMLSSLLGGLTVIPGGVKSKTCIEAGGRTLWSNFFNAIFLLAFLFVAPQIVTLLPKSALGAILIYTGWKMVHPSIISALAAVGKEQVWVYATTITVTLLSDLLIGVFCGTALKLLIVCVMRNRSESNPKAASSAARRFRDIFDDPVSEIEDEHGTQVLHVTRPVVSFNAFRLFERIEREQHAGRPVRVLIEEDSGVIDHTSIEALFRIARERENFELLGLDSLAPINSHPTAIRCRSSI